MCIYIYMSTYIYIYMCIYIHIYIYIYIFKGFALAASPLTCKNPHICEAVSRELQVLTVSDEISCELFLVNVKRLVLLGGILFV